MTKKFIYRGKLSRPIPAPNIGLLSDDEQLKRAGEDIASEQIRRMELLFKAHDVPEGNWIGLCYAMAFAHVPGFSVAKGKAGRTTKWTEIIRAELYLAVENTGLEPVAATELLSRLEPWASKTKRTRGAKTLYDEYFRADPRTVQMLRYAQLWENLPQEEKEQFLKEQSASIGEG